MAHSSFAVVACIVGLLTWNEKAVAQEPKPVTPSGSIIAIACEIVADISPGKVMIRGRIGAGAPTSGTFELIAGRPGPNDTQAVQSRQASDFTITSSAPVTVGNITFGGAGKAAATMLVKTPDGGFTVCTKAIDVP